jgi:hypothetical protein
MASHNIALGAETGIAVFWRRVLFAHLIEHEHFLVKTGSGQAQEKAEKKRRFCRRADACERVPAHGRAAQSIRSGRGWLYWEVGDDERNHPIKLSAD